MPWYVVQTKPKREAEVAQKLNQANYELFYPKMRGISSFKPLFPSYLFIRNDFENPFVHRMVRFTRGVRRILGDDRGPVPISDMIVETLREQTRNGSLIEQDLIFKENDQVLVKKGILKDLIGIIEKNMSAAGRVKVLFKWMQGRMHAVMRYTELEKVA